MTTTFRMLKDQLDNMTDEQLDLLIDQPIDPTASFVLLNNLTLKISAYDELDSIMAEAYSEDSESDLGHIGEHAALIMGYM